MASQNEIESAYNATKGKLDTIVSKMTALLAKIDAVNPDEPGALAKINAIADERTAARAEFNDGGGSAAFQNFRNLYDSSPEYQASFKSEYDSIWESFNSGKADSERLKARIELKKMSAESAEAKAKNNAPSANAAPVTPPAAPVPGNEPKNNLVGSADGDSNKDVNASQAALQQSSAAQQEIDKPTRRLYNPLAKFPSSTYNISLYMITPRAYDAFVASGRQKLNLGNGDVVTIAQSGGINSATQTRAAGFTLDYYIDNLRITTLTSAADTNAATNTSELDFNILEPYGFSFISNLKAAADDLIAKAKTDDPEYEQLDNSLRQFFILGIRFTGWNGDGTPASSKEDPLFERFYDIFLKSMTFKLDNKATVYSISAASMSPGVVFGTKRGVWDTGGTLRGRTVYDMLRNMMDQMNKQSADLVKGTKIKPNKYDFKFVGEGVGDTPAAQKASPIFKSLMVSPSDVTKASLVGSVPAKTDGNVPKDQGQPDTTVGEIKIASGTPILQAFLNIIQLSTFTTDAFKVIQTNALENNDKKANGQTQQKTDSQATVQWFNVSAECTGATYSKQLADFTWNIMYVFTIYETPVITNPYSNLGIDYYGPHKRYKYWFTGQNSEILSYSQTLDNTFFNVSLLPTSSNEETDSSNDISQTPGKKDNIENTGTQNVQDAAKKAYITSLFDPGAYANASIKIMGDPDFLMPDTQTSINSLYDKFYGTQGSFTVNPNSGQVFIEIDFKEPQDYGFKSSDNITYTATDDGLMGMNDKIKFWDYPKEIADIVEGVSYRVLSVKSVFNQGKFEQDIQCSINTFNGYESKGDQAQREASLEEVQVTGRRASAAGGQGQAPAGTSGGSNPSTLVADKPVTASAGGKGPGTTTNSTSGNSGQTSSNDDQNPPRGNLIINPPNLIEAGNINITAPNINLGRGGG